MIGVTGCVKRRAIKDLRFDRCTHNVMIYRGGLVITVKIFSSDKNILLHLFLIRKNTESALNVI